jgi:sugar lactone lactonase YvrE
MNPEPPTRRLIAPRRWSPPAAVPDQGRTAHTAELVVSSQLATGGHGPEDVVFDHDGRVLAGLADGTVVRIDPVSGDRTVIGDTGGRPLGVAASADGSVLVCDHDRGVLRLQPGGAVDVLVATVEGEPLRFASNIVELPDGTIWFTTSTSRWDLEHYAGDVFEHSMTGRLIRRDPDGSVTPVLAGLSFANGLVLAPDGSHLLFAETSAYRISRHWLAGPGEGTTEELVGNLPGFPDNMSLGSDGLLWVAIAAPRNGLLDRLLPLPGFLRLMLWNVPEALRPKAEPIAWVMAFDLHGSVVHDLRVADGLYRFITSVAEHDGMLVAGSLDETDVAVLQAPPRIP